LAHSFASNAASNTARSASNNASNSNGSNGLGGGLRSGFGKGDVVVAGKFCADVCGVVSEEPKPKGISSDLPIFKQRWARENYNAYQREYMKVYRAVRAGRAEFLNRGEK